MDTKEMFAMKAEMQKMCDEMMKIHEKMQGMISKMGGGEGLKEKMSKMKHGEDY